MRGLWNLEITLKRRFENFVSRLRSFCAFVFEFFLVRQTDSNEVNLESDFELDFLASITWHVLSARNMALFVM